MTPIIAIALVCFCCGFAAILFNVMETHRDGSPRLFGRNRLTAFMFFSALAAAVYFAFHIL